MYVRQQIALHTLRVRQAAEIRMEGVKLWERAMEVCAGDTPGFGHTSPCLIPAMINQQHIEMLVDTGATVSLISERMVNELQLTKAIEPWKLGPVKTANGNPLDIRGVISITARIGNAEAEYDAIVAKNLSRGIILGKDILEQMGAVIDLKHETVTLEGCEPVSFSGRVTESLEVQEACEVYMDGTYEIPAYSEMLVPLTTGGR